MRAHNDVCVGVSTRSPVDVVVEFIVTCKRQENTESRSQGEEDLCRRIDPDLQMNNSHECSQYNTFMVL